MSDRTAPGRRFEALDISGGNATISPACRAIIVGVAGIVTGIGADMSDAVATAELPAGWHPIQFKQINQSGTTADEITLVW